MSHEVLRLHRKSNDMIKIVFCFFLAAYPVLCQYAGFYRFTIGDLGLMAFTVIGVLPPPRQDRRIVSVATFLVYAVLVFLLNAFVFQNMPSWAMGAYTLRLIKLFFYFVASFTCGRKYFDLAAFERATLTVGVIAAGFMFFQYFAFYVLGKVYLGFIPGLTIFIEEYAQTDYEKLYSSVFRPCSIFLEPAMYVQYMIVPTSIALFSDRRKISSKALLVGVFSLSILLSTSAQGVFYLAIVFAMYAFMGKKRKKHTVTFLFGIVMVALVAYDSVDAVRFAFDRLLYSEGALSARTGAYEYLKNMPGPYWLLGYGYGVVPNGEFMAGATYVWYGCGVCGFALSVNMFRSFYKYAGSKLSRVLCAIFFIAFFVTSLFYNYMLFWYGTLILAIDDRKEHRDYHHHHYHYHHRNSDEEYD